VREERRDEIHAQPFFLPTDPALEMLRLQRVAVGLLALLELA
jgi:hypothetical protein